MRRTQVAGGVDAGWRSRMPGWGKRWKTKKVATEVATFIRNGADDRIRTGDLRFTRALLYQLSHIGIAPLQARLESI